MSESWKKITKSSLVWEELGRIDEWIIAKSRHGEFRLYHEPKDKSHASKARFGAVLGQPVCCICSKEVPQKILDVCLLGNVWLGALPK